ncbi:MAG: hypothetical protein KC589_05540 [Nanoarchaeota archaeon]|nr:hypothetical protein [Nanoarchaeota archaeon]
MNKKIKYEDAIELIKNKVAMAEANFRIKKGDWPSLTIEEDYIQLSKNLNIRQLSEKYGHTNLGTAILPGHDIAQILLKNHLERQNFFKSSLKEKKNLIIDGILGNLDYHPPEREYLRRIELLKILKETEKEYPDNFPEFVSHIKNISKVCFLNKLKKTKPDDAKKAYDNLGTFLVNPSGNLYIYLNGNGKTLEGLIKIWEESAQETKEYGDYGTYS